MRVLLVEMDVYMRKHLFQRIEMCRRLIAICLADTKSNRFHYINDNTQTHTHTAAEIVYCVFAANAPLYDE